MTNLDKLREITDRLVSWKPKAYHEGYIEINVSAGTSMAYKLMNEPSIAAAKVFFSKDTVYDFHSHAEKEYIVLYKGKIEILTDSMCKVLNPGDFCYLNAGDPHHVKALEDSWVICITVPASKEFPK